MSSKILFVIEIVIYKASRLIQYQVCVGRWLNWLLHCRYCCWCNLKILHLYVVGCDIIYGYFYVLKGMFGWVCIALNTLGFFFQSKISHLFILKFWDWSISVVVLYVQIVTWDLFTRPSFLLFLHFLLSVILNSILVSQLVCVKSLKLTPFPHLQSVS